MPIRRCALLSLLLGVALAACRPAAPPAGDATASPTAQADTAAATQTPASPPTPANDAASGEQGMKKTCAGATMRIAPDARSADGPDAPKTTQLYVETSESERAIDRPAEMQEHTAVGLACVVAKSDGRPYFVVEYGDLPYGCNFCEWFYLYDAAGTQLTHSDPPVLTDTSLPEGKQQSSNTKEYEQKIQSLGITHPELDYVK